MCIWDMHARACMHRFYDEGCIGGTSVAVSPDNQYLACGSSSGVINVYDLANVMGQAPAPVKMLSHLCTSVSALAFNSSSEILATASNQIENALKLVSSLCSYRFLSVSNITFIFTELENFQLLFFYNTHHPTISQDLEYLVNITRKFVDIFKSLKALTGA